MSLSAHPSTIRAPVAKIILPKAERAADAQLSRCRHLVEAITFESKAISNAGARLKHGVVGFSSKGGDNGGGLVAAYGFLGKALTLLAGSLSTEMLMPLCDAQRAIEEERGRRRVSLNNLEQQEATCAKLLEDCARRKKKVSGDLQTAMRERGDAERKSGWFAKKTLSTLTRKIEKATQMQLALTQELAQREEQLAAARLHTAEGEDAFKEMLVEADARVKQVVQPLLKNAARAWRDTAHAVSGIAEKLEADADKLASEGRTEHVIEDGDVDVDSEGSEEDIHFADAEPSQHAAPSASGAGTAVALQAPVVPRADLVDRVPTKAGAEVFAALATPAFVEMRRPSQDSQVAG